MTPFDTVWLAASVRLATPIALAATGETVAERAGIINIGLEGIMLSGAFGGYVIGEVTGSVWLGVLGALVVGALVALLSAVITVVMKADQIVVGVGLILLSIGATPTGTGFATQASSRLPWVRWTRGACRCSAGYRSSVTLSSIRSRSSIWPRSSWWVITLVLARTNIGLALRAVGDAPEAADTAGISVTVVRILATMTAGALAGVAGAFLSVGQLGHFNEQMSAGRGFLALAAVIFGRWRPSTVLAACFVFGAVDALQIRMQLEGTVTARRVARTRARRRGPRRHDRVAAPSAWTCAQRQAARQRHAIVVAVVLSIVTPQWHAPPQLWLAVPYIFTLAAMASIRSTNAAPRALGVAYARGAI